MGQNEIWKQKYQPRACIGIPPFVQPQVVERDDGLFAIGWHDDADGPFHSRRHAESVAASAGAKMAVSP